MKKNTFVIMFYVLIFLFFVSTEDINPSSQNITFVEEFTFLLEVDYGWFCEMFPTSSSDGYVLLGLFDFTLVVTKILNNFTMEWVSVIRIPPSTWMKLKNCEYDTSILETSDGGFIIGTSVEKPGNEGVVMKLSSNGSIMWNFTYYVIPYPSKTRGGAIEETDDGGYVHGVSEPYDRALSLMKLTSEGTLEWFVCYMGKYGIANWRSIRNAGSGSFYVAGGGNVVEEGESAILAKVSSSNGSFEWIVKAARSGEYFRAVAVNDKGEIIVAGKTLTYATGGKVAMMLAKFTSGGNLIWVKTLQKDSETSWYARKIRFTNDRKGFFVIGAFNPRFIAKFLDDGTLEWVSTFPDVSSVGSMCEKNDGSGYLSIHSKILSYVDENWKGCMWTRYDGNDTEHFDFRDRTGEIIFEFCSAGECIQECPSPIYVTGRTPTSNITYDEDVAFSRSFVCASYNCFGEYNSQCSQHGNCSSTDQCDCESLYYGDDCSVQECYGIMSNNTDLVCHWGDGECLDVNECVNCVFGHYGDQCEKQHPVSFHRYFESSVEYFPTGGDNYNHYWMGEGERSELSSVSITNDQSYLVLGNPRESPDRGSVLSRFHFNGSFDWSVEFLVSPYGGAAHVVLESPENSIYVVGNIIRSFECYDLFVAKLSSNGDMEWITQVSTNWTESLLPSLKMVGTHSVTQTSRTEDEGILIAHFLFYYNPAPFWDTVITKISSNGTVDFSTHFIRDGPLEGLIYLYPRSIIVSNDGQYIYVAGDQTEYYENSVSLFLLKLTIDGQTLEWYSTLTPNSGSNAMESCVDAIESNYDSTIIVLGRTGEVSKVLKTYIVKFDPNDGTVYYGVTIDSDDESELQTAPSSIIETTTGNALDNNEYDLIVTLEGLLLEEYYRTLIIRLDKDLRMKDVSVVEDDLSHTYGGGSLVEVVSDLGFFFSGKKESFDHTSLFTYFAKTYDGFQGCHMKSLSESTLAITAKLSTNFIIGLDDRQNFIVPTYETIFTHNVTANIGSAFYQSNKTVGDTIYSTQCFFDYKCYGIIDSKLVCSAHGDCVADDTCACVHGYFGEECEHCDCFGFLSNDTGEMYCSGHGDCILHDKCSCMTGYEAVDCSDWKCFGLWKNDTNVCNGDTDNNSTTSHGNCTSPDMCTCEKGYLESQSCDWECWGTSHWKEDACGEHGDCVDYNKCNCSTSYIGETCDIPTCGGISSLDTKSVCSGHGKCDGPDECDCDLGYSSEEPGFCDWWSCRGISANAKSSVCSSHGKCDSYNGCGCDEEYSGDDCETWACGGYVKEDVKTCSSHGECKSPGACECRGLYRGDFCQTNTGYTTVMAPSLGVGGIVGAVVLILVSILCCCLCICLCCTGLSLILGLAGYLFTQTFRWKKFSKLRNIDILLQEQEADENTDVAHIRMNKKLFEVNYKDIKITKILGEGGSNSTVYLASWRGQKIAFKCFRTRQICSTQETFDEFEREAEVFSSISHPNIVRFFGCTMDPPRVGILMEFCEKGECLEYILMYETVNDNKYPMSERLRMIYEISSAMDYLNAKGIIHRDLKCENVLLDRTEACKLMDFGLARISENIAQMQNQTKGVGTCIFMAPEIVLGEGGYDEKVDVFSLGIMCFCLVTGKENPYGDVEMIGIESKVARDPLFRPDVDVMRKCLKEDEEWIIETSVKCWDHESKNRPSFHEICEIVQRKNQPEKEEKKEEEEVVSETKKTVVGHDDILDSSEVENEGEKKKTYQELLDLVEKLKEENQNLKAEKGEE